MDYRERWELRDYLFGRVLERRILLLHVGVVIILLGFLLNFWYLQGVHGDEYAGLAENNRLRRIPLRPTRGEIFDRDREVIASTRPSLNIMLRREGAHDLDGQLERLSAIIDVPLPELLTRLAQMRGRPQFEPLVVKEDVSLAELARIEVRREKFPSVEVRQQARRHYPEGPIASHAIGYVGEVSEAQLIASDEIRLQRGDIVGKSGIERTYDSPLRGDRGWMVVSVNNLGRQMGDSRIGREADHGLPLEVTLDLDMQRELMEGFGEEAGAGVFMDPWTGEILALASTPAFDPNQFADGISVAMWKSIIEDPRRPLHDRAIASYYAPGSTFKVLMAVAGMESGSVSADQRVFCSGSVAIYGHRRLCWKKGGHGWVDLESALAYSCNVYFYLLGRDMKIEPIEKYSALFGLGRPSGIDLPGEEAGILPSPERKLRVQREPWWPGDTISVAIGQGLIAVTPVQMVRMISVVATDGRLVRPHVFSGERLKPERVPVSERTLQVVKRGLTRAVESGTARRATGGEFTVAGKTGTAQVFKHSAGIDADKMLKAERDHAWFVGYAPADRPLVAFAIVVEHGGHGGTTAAPIARRVLEVYFAERADEAVEPPDLHAEMRPAEGGDDVGTPSPR